MSYADTWKPTRAAEAPVEIILAFGEPDSETTLMDWAREPEPAVVAAVRELREDSNFLMAVDLPWEVWDGGRPENTRGTFVVLDTNVLLRYLPLLRAIVGVLSESGETAAGSLELVVPHAAIRELDGLKNSTRVTARSLLVPEVSSDSPNPPSRTVEASIGNLSRAASNWLLDVVASPAGGLEKPTFVRGQRQHESLIPRINGRRDAGSNDDEILDVCQFLSQDAKVILLSDDRNLCLKARIEKIDTLSLDEHLTPRQLLERIDSPLAARLYSPFSKSTPSPSLPTTPRRCQSSPPSSQSTPSPSNTPSRHSPRPAPRCSVPPSPLSPSSARPWVPPEPTPSATMDIDTDSIPIPPFEPLPLPRERPLHSPSSVVSNADDFISHLISIHLHRHVFLYLRRTSPATYDAWAGELGDWRRWEAQDVVKTVRRWWDDAGVKEICVRGLNHAASAPPPPKPTPPSVDRALPRDSRWASPPTLSPAPTPRPSLPSSLPSLPYSKSLAELHTSLPNLLTAFSTPSSAIASWSAPRHEIFLETLQPFLIALVGGFLDADVSQEVGAMVRRWAEGLRSVGVGLDRVVF